MSWASKFIFDPIRAAIARAGTSSNPAAHETAAAAGQVVAKVEADVSPASLSANSAMAIKDRVVKDLEDGLKDVVDAFVASAVGEIPVVGGLASPFAVKAANTALNFAEQHAMTYVSALFAHHASGVNAPPAATPGA